MATETKTDYSPKLWGRYRKAFASVPVQTYALVKGGQFIGSVAFKFPRDGAGRLQAFVCLTGDEYGLQAGSASGYGYDKQTAALGGMTIHGVTLLDQGEGWNRQLRAAGIEAFPTMHS